MAHAPSPAGRRPGLAGRLAATTAALSPRELRLWLAVTLAVSFALDLPGLLRAFDGPYVIADDARQHVFWMQRFLDPGLFPNDLIADYFQAVAPWGYATLYRLPALLGVNPLLLSKLLPPLIGLATTWFCYRTALLLLPVPLAGFVASVLIHQGVDFVSATQRTFATALLLAFLLALLRRSVPGVLAAIALQALFYPAAVFLSLGVLGLGPLRFERGVRLARERRDYLLFGAALAVAALALAPFAAQTAAYGPAITAAEARGLPEFSGSGRAVFFQPGFYDFWINDRRSGFLPKNFFKPLLLAAGLLLPLLLRLPGRFPLAGSVSAGVGALGRLALASATLFAAAHLLLFRLHHPSRYTQYSLRIVLALAAGMAVALFLDAAARHAAALGRPLPAAAAVALCAAALATPYALWGFKEGFFHASRRGATFRYFAAQPRDVLVASLTGVADDLPTFAARSVLVSRETALPYHTGYYREIRERASALIRASYSTDPAELRAFIRRYGVTHFVVDRDLWSARGLARNGWVSQFPAAAARALATLRAGGVPALLGEAGRCAQLQDGVFTVIDAGCLLEGPGAR